MNGTEITNVRTRHGSLDCFTLDSGAITRSLTLYGEWAENELRFLHRFIPAGACVVDVGGYIGTHAVAFGNFVGSEGRILTIEPQPASFAVLERNLRANRLDHARAIHAAVGAQNGEITIPVIDTGHQGGFGSQALCRDGVQEAGAVTVPLITIDSLALDACAAIKIDVEGFEDLVIAGAEETIRRHRPLIYAECNTLEAGLRSWAALRKVGLAVRMHVVQAFNPDNFNHASENIFADARECALVGFADEALARLATQDLGPGEMLIEIETADDLALGLLNKPQYIPEVLEGSAAARSGGGAWVDAQSRLRLDHEEGLRTIGWYQRELEEARRREASLAQERQARINELEANLDQVVAQHEEERAALRQQIESALLQSSFANASAVAALAKERQAQEAAVDCAARLEAILNSTSWRLTRPLRLLRTRLKGQGSAGVS